MNRREALIRLPALCSMAGLTPQAQQAIGSTAVFNVLDFAPAGVTINNGVGDATSAFLAALSVARNVYVPMGIYKITSPLKLLIGTKLFGVPYLSIIKPSAALRGNCIVMGSNSTLEGIYIDGVNTRGARGLSIGSDSLANIVTVRDVNIWRFTGTSASGIFLADGVTCLFTNVYAAENEYNLITQGSAGGPTDSIFISCQFCKAVKKGVWVKNGYSINFLKCLFESNGEEGAYFQNNGDNAVEIDFSKCWFETNWQSVAAGATRHARYDIYVDGATGPAGTIRPRFRDCKHAEGATVPRAMHLTNATGFVVDNCKMTNEAGQVLVDGSSYGNFEAWPASNGAFLSTVTNTSGGAWNSRSHIEDTIESAWTDWTPSYSGSGSMTVRAIKTVKARYKVVGKTVRVQLNFSLTTGGTPSANIILTLPINVRTLDSNGYDTGWLTDGENVQGYTRGDGAKPTSSIRIGRTDGANLGLGAGRAFVGTLEFELF